MLPLFVEMLHQTKSTLDSVKNFVQLTRGEFRDREFGDFFCRAVTKDIEKTDRVFAHFLDYIEVSSPVSKRGTVHTLIEESLDRHQTDFKKKKIEVSKCFEDDLPEVTVPDESLQYIFETLVQYATVFLPFYGRIEFLTQLLPSPTLPFPDEVFPEKDGKCVEVSVSFAGIKTSEARLEASIRLGETLPDLELRLVEDVVKRNHGTVKWTEEAQKDRTCISMAFPGERRKRVHYQAVHK
jgi:signal transduction histidine kinase